DPLGNVAEFSSANLWIAKDGAAHTPVPNGTFLNGITRQRVIRLLRAAGVEVHERSMTFQDVLDADEVFSTGNYGKVMPITGVDGMRFFVMTSGLRSLRDKVIAYLDRALATGGEPPRTMLDAIGVYTGCLRVVTEEDKGALERSHLGFDLHALIGGQLADDPEPTIFLVYPVGNWIQIGERTPYLAIGN